MSSLREPSVEQRVAAVWAFVRQYPPFTDDPALAALTDEQLAALESVFRGRADALRTARHVPRYQPFPKETLRPGDRVKLRVGDHGTVPYYLNGTWATVVSVGSKNVTVMSRHPLAPNRPRAVHLEEIEERAERE